MRNPLALLLFLASLSSVCAQSGLTQQVGIQPIQTGSSPAASSSPATTNNPAAAKLINQANDALIRQDYGAASKLLDQAKDLNPTQTSLNGGYGALSYSRGEMTEAIRFYQKEAALHPESMWVYAPMSRAQVTTGHPADAVASLRAWAAAAPTNPAATAALVEILLTQNDPAAAFEAATRGIAALPEDKRADPTLQFALGKAQLAAGHSDDGVATLVALLNASDDPLMLNNAAYELSRTGKNLPLAEASSRRSLAALAAESRTWTLDESPAILRQKSSLIVSSWDTLGWILFNEGKLNDAEDFVRAAWLNAPNPEVGEHLGDIEARLGNHQQALQTYALALAAIPSSNSLGARTPPGPQSKALAAKIDIEKKLAAKTSKSDPHLTLASLRTVPLGPPPGAAGSARYTVLLTHGQIIKAQPVDDKSLPGIVPLILKAELSHYIPIDTSAVLARPATVTCSEKTCTLTFEP